MHSSLGRELRGTSRLFRTVHARSSSRSAASKRGFTSHTRLLREPGANNNSASGGGNKTTSQTDQKELTFRNREPSSKWRATASSEGTIPKFSGAHEEMDVISGENGVRAKHANPKEARDPVNAQNPGQSTNEAQSHEEQGSLPKSEDRKEPSATSGQPTSPEGPPDDSGKQDARPAHPIQVPEQESASREDPNSSEQDNTSNNKFYGSASARRQREKHTRSRDKSSSYVLPDWFCQNSVLSWPDTHIIRDIEPRFSFLDRHMKIIYPDGEEAEQRLSSSHVRHSVDTPASPHVTDRSTLVESADTVSLMPNPEQSLVKLRQAATETEDLNTDSQPLAAEAIQDQPGMAKKQTVAACSPEEPHKADDAPGTAEDDSHPSDQQSTTIPVNQDYRLHRSQFIELYLTLQGRLRLPTSGTQQDHPSGIRSHALIHYTAPDADLLLHHLMIDMARYMRCSLIQLDAQDISALISKADIDPMLADQAKTLSYEVFGEAYREGSSEEEDQHPMIAEEMEEDDEDRGSGPRGSSVLIGKIDLMALFGPKGSRKGNSSFFPKNMIHEGFGRTQMGKTSSNVFAAIVDSILSSTQHVQKLSDREAVKNNPEFQETIRSLKQPIGDATIVHVKDLRAIQDTSVGKHFLMQLYDQVDRRRSNGESIMIVGTECARESNHVYDIERLCEMQVSQPNEISSTVILTPIPPNASAKEDNKQPEQTIAKRDRTERLRVINARHLYEMLQSKSVIIEPLREGFWTKNLDKILHKYDRECLANKLWSFSYVQRLAALLASSTISSFAKLSPDSNIAAGVLVLKQSDSFKAKWVKETQPQTAKPNKRETKTEDAENERLSSIRSKATKHEKKLLSGVVEPKKISTTFNDIHIPAETVDALQTLTTLSLVRPDAFQYGVLATDRIPGLLLYGPPGTGKTLAAKAVARESGATMLEVSAADINDMYVGEGEKNVKALFSLAKKLSPCIVFLDEADAMFSSRSHVGRRVSHRELLNQFLKEWDGMSNDSGSAFIMVATNRPMDLDDAVLRRLPRRLLIDLPTEKDRVEILKIHLGGEQIAGDVHVHDLAARTPFYSGSDLKNLVVAAALNCVREENERAKKHTGEEPFKYEAKRTLTAANFEKALEEIGASISEDMASLRDIKKFDEQYGDKKGRKRRSPKWGFKTVAEADSVLDTIKVRSS